MLVRELTIEECWNLLSRNRLGRIACARDNQPYVVPFYFAFQDNSVYAFATVGQRVEWMRANPLVCVEVDEIVTPQQWQSVIVLGRYEELPDTPEFNAARVVAYDLLHKRSNWWEPGYVETMLKGSDRPMEPVYYRIHVNEITGRVAIHDDAAAAKP